MNIEQLGLRPRTFTRARGRNKFSDVRVERGNGESAKPIVAREEIIKNHSSISTKKRCGRGIRQRKALSDELCSSRGEPPIEQGVTSAFSEEVIGGFLSLVDPPNPFFNPLFLIRGKCFGASVLRCSLLNCFKLGFKNNSKIATFFSHSTSSSVARSLKFQIEYCRTHFKIV